MRVRIEGTLTDIPDGELPDVIIVGGCEAIYVRTGCAVCARPAEYYQANVTRLGEVKPCAS